MFNIKKLIRAVVVFLALAALVFVSAFVTTKVATWGRTVVVPGVAGKDLAESINQLKKSGLGIKVDHEEYHASVPAGSVISQSPLPGASVKKGRYISVVVSLGSKEITVPDLTGEPFRRAQVALRQAGLVLSEVARVCSDSPRDSVVAQDPPARSVLQKGGRLNLLVSDGPEEARYITPDLTGKTVEEAGQVMKPMRVGVSSSTGKGSVVASQYPPPGYPISAGESVKVALVARPAPQPAHQPDKH